MDWIKPFSEIVTALATPVLAYATWNLWQSTANMAREAGRSTLAYEGQTTALDNMTNELRSFKDAMEEARQMELQSTLRPASRRRNGVKPCPLTTVQTRNEFLSAAPGGKAGETVVPEGKETGRPSA